MSQTNGWISVDVQESLKRLTSAVTGDIAQPNIPSGHKELKNVSGVFLSDREIIITGDPDEDNNHNCDAMGCSSVEHVIFRANLKI